MKKLLALALSVMMAASLAVPAFADGPDGPPSDDHWEDAVPISAPIDEDFQWWTVEDEWEYVCEEYPERVALFLEEVEEWYAQHAGLYLWYGADTFDEFVENVGGEEAAYLTLFYDWNWEYERELARREFITAHGGVPGQIGVMVNGRYIKFPDAAPEVMGGRTMAPVQALVEALGGEVSVHGSDVRCSLDGMTVIFTAGSREAVVELEADEDDGCEQQAWVLDMDCAPYVKGGRTYVPVRFLGEMLGCVVVWESSYQTVVLNDIEAMTAEIDRDFTILNRVLANATNPVEEGKNYRCDFKGDVTVTAFDTLNGSTTYQAGIGSDLLMNSEAVNGTYTLTMSESVLDELMKSFVGYGWDEEEYAEDAAMLRKILGNLKDIEIIVIREGLYWVHVPVLDELAGEKDIWCGLPAEEDIFASAFAGTEAATVGQLVAQSTYSGSYVTVWSDAMDTAARLAAVMGDECFTTSGGTSTLTLDMDKLDPDGELGLKDELKECTLTLKVDGKGGAALSCAVQTAEGRKPGMRLTVDASLSDGRLSLTANVHVSNVGEMKLTLTSQRRTTGEAPVSEPPEGANIVDAPELLEGLVHEGYSSEP